MNGKVLGTILGVVGVLLWFMPLAYVNFRGVSYYQAGNHVGGIAYILLFSSLAYVLCSWIEQHVPRIIAASVALAICLLFAVQAGSFIAWGLIALIIVSFASLLLAVRDIKSIKAIEN